MTTEKAAPAAYDYDRQEWVSGDAAVVLLNRQRLEELEMLSGPTGEDYARFIGITDREGAIRDLRVALGLDDKPSGPTCESCGATGGVGVCLDGHNRCGECWMGNVPTLASRAEVAALNAITHRS